MEKHTPTPWKIKKLDNNVGLKITAPGRVVGCIFTQRYLNGEMDDRLGMVNAELIVKAVNNHEQLVKALEPFAKLGEELTDLKSSEHWIDDRVIFAYNNVPLTFGDVKTAFNLLSQLESK